MKSRYVRQPSHVCLPVAKRPLRDLSGTYLYRPDRLSGEKREVIESCLKPYASTRPFTVNRLRPSRSVFDQSFFIPYFFFSPNRFVIIVFAENSTRRDSAYYNCMDCFCARVFWSYDNIRGIKTLGLDVITVLTSTRIYRLRACSLLLDRCLVHLSL